MNNTILRRTCTMVLALALCAGVAVIGATPAAAKTTAAIGLRGPVSGTYGTTINLTGVLWRYRTSVRIPGATVYLQRATHGRSNWTTVKSTKTSRTGTFTFGVVQSRPYDYRARWSGSSTYTGALSGRVYPAVAKKVILDSFVQVDATDFKTQQVEVRGRIFPAPTGQAGIYMQRYVPSTRAWHRVPGGYIEIRGNRVRFVVDLRHGRAPFRLRADRAGLLAAGNSPAGDRNVYRMRGLFVKPFLGKGTTGDPLVSEWTDRGPDMISAPVEPLRSAWVDINSSRCHAVEGFIEVRWIDEAAVISVVTASGKQLYAQRFDRSNQWRSELFRFSLAQASRVRITGINRDRTSKAEFVFTAWGDCYD